MPPLETFDLTEWAVLWEIEGHDHRGRPLRGEPVEVRVRWTPVTEDVLDAAGQKVAITVRVGIGREVPVDSWMWLGRLDDWYEEGSAGQMIGLMQVVVGRWARDDKGRAIRYSLGLRRYRDQLPALSE